MSLETKSTLSEETVDKLQKLIKANIDSYDGFMDVSMQVNDAPIAFLFNRLALERSENATELQSYVEWNGEDAAVNGTLSAALHRAWINVRSALNDGDSRTILTEVERGEDHIKHAYEDVLTETAGSAMNDVLLKQYQNVKAGHDLIRNLRDQFKNEE